ncbi:MAG: hypothetical protein ACLRW3_03020 [Eubacterium sp.]
MYALSDSRLFSPVKNAAESAPSSPPICANSVLIMSSRSKSVYFHG